MIELYLLRHAHAGDPDAWDGPDDARPLSPKGRAQAERVGAWLARLDFRPVAIVSSPKLRARETAELVAAALGRQAPPVGLDERLAEPFDLAMLGSLLDDLGRPGRVVLVGHDPDFSDMLIELTGATSLSMKKGALARVDLDGPEAIEAGTGALRWLIPPDAIPG
jgi:phosphohistidine phosphatase